MLYVFLIKDCIDVACYYYVAWSVCLFVCLYVCLGHTGELCKNGRTDRDAIWGQTLVSPRNYDYVRWGPRSEPQQWALLKGRVLAHNSIPTHKCIRHCLSATAG